MNPIKIILPFIVLFAIVIIGCILINNRRVEKVSNTINMTESKYKTVGRYLLKEFVYDSCEYILVNGSVTHKGNCKFCIERNK